MKSLSEFFPEGFNQVLRRDRAMTFIRISLIKSMYTARPVGGSNSTRLDVANSSVSQLLDICTSNQIRWSGSGMRQYGRLIDISGPLVCHRKVGLHFFLRTTSIPLPLFIPSSSHPAIPPPRVGFVQYVSSLFFLFFQLRG